MMILLRCLRGSICEVFPTKIITANRGNYFTSPVTTGLLRFRKLQLLLTQQWIQQDLAKTAVFVAQRTVNSAITTRLGILFENNHLLSESRRVILPISSCHFRIANVRQAIICATCIYIRDTKKHEDKMSKQTIVDIVSI